MQERLSFPARLGLGGQTGLRSIEDFWRVTPLARKRPPNMASLLPAVTSLIAGVAARKPDHGTGFGEDNHGAAERAAMFAKMRFCMNYCTEPATRSTSPRVPIDAAHCPRN